MSKSEPGSEAQISSDSRDNPFQSVKTGDIDEPRVTKHGLTTAGLEEQPIDMIEALLHEKRIQEEDKRIHGETGALYFFMADAFEALNKDAEEAEEFLRSNNTSREIREDYLSAASEIAGIDDLGFVRSDEVFSDQVFYDIALDVVSEAVESVEDTGEIGTGYNSLTSAKRDVESILPESVINKGMNGDEALEIFGEVYDVEIPPELHDVVDEFESETGEEMKAAHWYGMFEIAASEWMRRENGINNKSGHDKENIYDKKISDIVGTSRYNQPTSLGSQMQNAGTRIPYTVWPGREDSRILLSDSGSEIADKVETAPTNYVVTAAGDVPGYVWNPVIEKGITAAEMLSTTGEGLTVGDQKLESAEEVIDYALNVEPESYSIDAIAEATLEKQYSSKEVQSSSIDQNAVSEIRENLPEAYEEINREIRDQMET